MTGLLQPPLHPHNQPRPRPLHLTIGLFQTSLTPTAIAAPCTNLFGQPLQHRHRVHPRLLRAHGSCAPAQTTPALPVSPKSHLHIELFTAPKKVNPATTTVSLSVPFLLIICWSYSTLPQPFLRAHGLSSHSASTPCPLTSTPQIGILVLQCLRNFRAIRTFSLQSNPNSQIHRKSNRSQSKLSPMNRPITISPQSVFNQLQPSPLRPFLHLPKHPQFGHRRLPSNPPPTEHARHAPPLKPHTNHHLPPPLPPPAVKTRSFS